VSKKTKNPLDYEPVQVVVSTVEVYRAVPGDVDLVLVESTTTTTEVYEK
jgi:hypothetical protein